MDQLEPHYTANAIHCGDDIYEVHLDPGEAAYLGDRHITLELSRGESPRRVCDGFVYGGYAFLPRYDRASQPAIDHATKLADQVLALDAENTREAATARSIPRELEPMIWERACNQESHRSIARWLSEEMDCHTSYTSVGRVVARLKLEEATGNECEALENDILSLRVQLGQLLETVMDLLADFHEHCDKSPGENQKVPAVLRTHLQLASIIERRLSVASRDLGKLVHRFGPPERRPAISSSEGIARGPGAVLPSRPPTPPEQTATPAKVPESAKILGRNHPCPCGSGRKYKQCCLKTAALRSRDTPPLRVAAQSA